MGDVRKGGVWGRRQGTHFLLNAGGDKDAHSAECHLRKSSQLLTGIWQWCLEVARHPNSEKLLSIKTQSRLSISGTSNSSSPGWTH